MVGGRVRDRGLGAFQTVAARFDLPDEAAAAGEFDYRFERTRVQVRLHRDAHVSRSEARRMLHGLDRFREVVLDFKGVKSIGQGFADEVFRVFRRSHPATTLQVENLAPALVPALRHALDDGE